MSKEGQNENGVSEEETTKDKSKRRGTRYNPFKRLRRKEKREDHPWLNSYPRASKVQSLKGRLLVLEKKAARSQPRYHLTL